MELNYYQKLALEAVRLLEVIKKTTDTSERDTLSRMYRELMDTEVFVVLASDEFDVYEDSVGTLEDNFEDILEGTYNLKGGEIL